ncbi:conjugal transfer protein TraG N-terminal domain-containing protein [Aliarcobacter butzleri]|uniref:conjugal transfer protein TraG n=1 Tax=Aliarcobacter butzleri TaxID=28197 RepID=UPI001EDB6B97|nr:conjugal transfer protein TraG N-terminal domain-containing protein [Aliarcobacter butzleri]MCG3686449.1 conjugal transfer protein TraG N-terminal domain-containing protein [Aliarcobacter butzleri]
MVKKVLFIFFFFTGCVFAVETAYSWGYGDLMVETFKVVKYVFSMNEFNDAWKIAMIISLIAGMIMMMSPNPDFLRLGKIWVLAMGVYTMFTAAKIDIYVEDKVDNNNSGLVTNVPWAVGYPLGLFSAIEYRLGATYEVATSIPNGMKYSDSGFFTPISIFSQATKHQIVSPYLYQNLTNYIQECVMPDLENGYKDYRTLIDSDNVWAYLGNTSPATFILISDEDNNSSLVTCPTAYNQLNGALQNYVGVGGVGMEHLGKTLGSLTSSVVSNQLGIANQYLLNTSKTASQMLLQNVAINTFSESFRNYVNLNGADLNNAAYHSASASQAASAQMIISGILGSKYIPVIKGILTVIIIGLTPILALIMITPMGLKTLFGYITILGWLACWHFGDVILNHIITTKAQSALSSYGDIKFNTRGLIDSTTMDYINMASSMYWTIPTIAFIIATGFSISAFASLNNSMTTKLDRTSSATGGDMAKGNMQFSNVSHDTYNGNKTNAMRENNFGQNTTFRDFSSGEFGTQSNTVNGKATQSGTQSITGGIGANESYNNLMSGMGKSLDFNSITGDSQAAGKDVLGNQIYQATSSMSVSGNGVNGTISAGSTYTKDKNGEVHLLDASLDAKNLNGESIESTYKGGMEHKRTMTDSVGNKMESTTMDNGVDKNFKWTSGLDNGSFVSGVYHARSNQAEVTDGIVNGVKLDHNKSSDTTYGSSTIKAATKEMALNEANQELLSKINGEVNSISSEGSNTTSGSVGAGFKVFGTGAGVENVSSMKFGEGNSLTVDYKNGETKTISLSENEKNSLQSSLQKNATESEKLSSSRDLMPKQLESIINSNLRSDTNINDTMENIVRKKDSLNNLNNEKISNGVKSSVENSSFDSNLEKKFEDKSILKADEQKNKNHLIRTMGYGDKLEDLISQSGKVVSGKEKEYNELYNKASSKSNDGKTNDADDMVDRLEHRASKLTKGVDDIKDFRNDTIAKAQEKGFII